MSYLRYVKAKDFKLKVITHKQLECHSKTVYNYGKTL